MPRFEECLALGRRYERLDLEIGCGVGWHPIVYAKTNSDRGLIAIEHTVTKFESFESRLRRNPEIPNLAAVHANAVSWLAHAPAALTFDRVLFMYPNPEPKNAAKRWIRMPFFGALLERLRPAAEILIVTNEAGYAREVETEAKTRWGLNKISLKTISRREDPEFKPRTHFEKKYFLRDEILHELRISP